MKNQVFKIIRIVGTVLAFFNVLMFFAMRPCWSGISFALLDLVVKIAKWLLRLHGVVPLFAEPDVFGDFACGKEAFHHLRTCVTAECPHIRLVAVGHHKPLVRHLPRHFIKTANVIGDLFQSDTGPVFAHFCGYQRVRLSVKTIAFAVLGSELLKGDLGRTCQIGRAHV